MAMNAIKEQKQLPLKYQKITSYVGFSGVCLGLLILVELSSRISNWFGIEPDVPVRLQVDSEFTLYLYLGSLLISLVLSIYAGVVCIAGLFSLMMCMLGKFTLRESIFYALFSKLPNYWKNPY